MAGSRKLSGKFGDVTISTMLSWFFIIWPLLYSLWVSFNFTVRYGGARTPIYLLWGAAVVSLALNSKLKSSFLYIWFLFLAGVSAMSVLHRVDTGAWFDFSVILSCVVFCLGMCGRETVDVPLLTRAVQYIGFFIAVTVLIGSATGIFSNELLSLYAEGTRETFLSHTTHNGGIFPHTSTAGCYICAGIGAFYVRHARREEKKLGVVGWGQVLVFVLSFLLLRKRGFTLDIVLTFPFLWAVSLQPKKNMRINVTRQIRTVAVVLALAGVAVALYFLVEAVHVTVDDFLNRFFTEDETFSGRTMLYDLAISLFRQSPVTGIGWGKYRANTLGIFHANDATFETHNVYLQLLCETGVVGLLLFLLVVGVTLIATVRKYRLCLRAATDEQTQSTLRLSLYLQVFFLAYCVSGNPLYDMHFLVTYFGGILLAVLCKMPDVETAGLNGGTSLNAPESVAARTRSNRTGVRGRRTVKEME